ncbi:MAG: magnesium transporter [Pirellulaceae bacterium]|jgi:magnesium transporter|nr:magnesium transporter [Pirellulaceae bacterium]
MPASAAPPSPFEELALDHAHRDFAYVRIQHTVAEALAAIRASDVQSRIVYFYVLDEEGRLAGVLPTRRLLLSAVDTKIRELMIGRYVALPETATMLDACEMFIVHRLLALPIVDAERRIVGVIDVEEASDDIRELDIREASNDIFQLIGVRIAQVQRAPLRIHLVNRFPWLLCNIGGGLACALIAGFFQEVLDQVILLALFIPVVLALAESVSIQALTLTLSAQHGGRPTWRSVGAALTREIPLGILLGASCGSLVFLAAWAWRQQLVAAFCVFAGILLSVTTATILGLVVPSAMLALKRDPQVASGPITLAITDILTMIYYLGLATWLLL